MAVPVFKISDLTRNQLKSPQAGFSVGDVGLLGPDQDPDDFTPISPWVAFGRVKARLNVLEHMKVDALDIAQLDDIALAVGREFIGAAIAGSTALCSQDMATCAANPRISPVASIGETFTNIDVAVLRAEAQGLVERIDEQFG